MLQKEINNINEEYKQFSRDIANKKSDVYKFVKYF